MCSLYVKMSACTPLHLDPKLKFPMKSGPKITPSNQKVFGKSICVLFSES